MGVVDREHILRVLVRNCVRARDDFEEKLTQAEHNLENALDVLAGHVAKFRPGDIVRLVKWATEGQRKRDWKVQRITGRTNMAGEPVVYLDCVVVLKSGGTGERRAIFGEKSVVLVARVSGDGEVETGREISS